MRLGVYSCMTPDLRAEELVGLMQDIGFSGVEWTLGYRKAVWDEASQWHIRADKLDEDIRHFRDLGERHGLATYGVSSIYSIFDNELPELLRAAAELGSPVMRFLVSGYSGARNYRDLLTEARTALPRVERLSREAGVKTILEIHHRTILPRSSAAMRLVEGFDPNWIGVLHDAGNMIHEGFENWRMGIEMLGSYLAHVHVKNYGRVPAAGGDGVSWTLEPKPIDTGEVDFGQILSALMDVNYQGAITLEDFRGGYGCVPVGITSEQKLREDYAAMTRLQAAVLAAREVKA